MSTYDTLVTHILHELESALNSVNPAQMVALSQAVLQAQRIFFAGKGRSGLQMRAGAMRLMHLGLTVHVVDDVTTPAITAHDLLFIGSGSGKTASLVQYAGRAKEAQARLALITITPASPIAELADYVVYVNAPTPKLANTDQHASILPMGSLFEQTLGLLLDILCLELMAELGVTSGQMFSRHTNLE